jgi:hypothetical protein
MLTNVATHYAQEAGSKQSASILDYKTTGPLAATSNGQSMIVVDNNGKINKEAGFTGNMISSFVHEEGHKNGLAGTALGEIKAITKQVNDPSFIKDGNDPKATTPSFRQAIGAYAASNLNKGLGNKTITTTQATGIINKLNASPLGRSCELFYAGKLNPVISIISLSQVTVNGLKK